MTGRYPHSNGINGLTHLGWEYNASELTLAHRLTDAGYHTTLIGLQHESADPRRLGYREVVSLGTGDDDPPYCGPVADETIRWLQRRRAPADPFFLTVGFYEAHRPYPPDRYPPDDPEHVGVPCYLPDNDWTRDDLAALHGSIRAADVAVGRILDCLSDTGRDHDTWVMFTTDHGIAFPGAKSTLYEPGVGVAMLVRPPTSISGCGRTPRLFSHVDFVPTVLDLLNLNRPDTLHGVSHAAFLLGRDSAPVRDAVFCEKTYHDVYDPIRAVRTASWSYIRNLEARPVLTLPLDIFTSPTARGYGSGYLRHRDTEELYDLRMDPDETTNLAGHPQFEPIRAELNARLDAWQRDTDDPARLAPIPPVPMPRLARYGALPRPAK